MAGSEIASGVFGLVSAASWGAGDFCGGLASKRSGACAVVIGSQLIGGVMLFLAAVVLKDNAPPLPNLFWAAVAGVLGSGGLLALYRSLAVGHMGTAAPVSAVVTAALPVLAGAVVEGVPGAIKLLGFALAIVSVWFVSQAGSGRVEWKHLGLPVAAGVGFGLFLVLMNRVNGGAVFWPLVAARAASLIVLSAAAAISKNQILPQASHWPLVGVAGLLDAGGNTFYVLASQAGRLDVAAVLSSLYPASTVVLAWLILKERITRLQAVGIVAAVIAIAMITN